MRVIKKLALLFTLGALVVGWSGVVYADKNFKSINPVPPIPEIVARVKGNDISAKHIKFQFMQVLKNTQSPITSA